MIFRVFVLIPVLFFGGRIVEFIDLAIQNLQLVPIEATVHRAVDDPTLFLSYEIDGAEYLSPDRTHEGVLPAEAEEKRESLQSGDRVSAWVHPRNPRLIMISRLVMDPWRVLELYVTGTLGALGLALCQFPSRLRPDPPSPSSIGYTLHPMIGLLRARMIWAAFMTPAVGWTLVSAADFLGSDFLDWRVFVPMWAALLASGALFRRSLKSLQNLRPFRAIQVDLDKAPPRLTHFRIIFRVRVREGYETKAIICRLGENGNKRTKARYASKVVSDNGEFWCVEFERVSFSQGSSAPRRLQSLIQVSAREDSAAVHEFLVQRSLEGKNPEFLSALTTPEDFPSPS